MARSDVEIFFSTNKPAMAYVSGAEAKAATSAVAASGTSGSIGVEVNVTGAAALGQAGVAVASVPDEYLYVAKTGSNSNPGTQASPFLTISYGMSQLTSGQRLVIMGGVYTEQLTANAPSGTPGNPTQIHGNPGDTVELRAPSGGTRCIWMFNPARSYVEFQNLYLNGANGNMHNGIKIEEVGHHHLTFRDIEVDDAVTSGILDVGGNSAQYSAYHEFHNVWCHDCGVLGSHVDHGMYLTTSNNKVWDSRFNRNGSYGYQCWNDTVSCNDNDFRRNRSWDNTDGGSTMNGQRATYTNCIYWDNGQEAIRFGGGSSTGSKVYNCTFYSNSQFGFLNQTGSSVELKNCILYQNSNNISGSATQATNLTTDPSFVNVAADDFHIQSGSAARNAGTDLSPTVTDDFDGVTRPNSPDTAYAIGAYEYDA